MSSEEDSKYPITYTRSQREAFDAGEAHGYDRGQQDAQQEAALPTMEELRKKPTGWHQDPENQKIVQRVLEGANQHGQG